MFIILITLNKLLNKNLISNNSFITLENMPEICKAAKCIQICKTDLNKALKKICTNFISSSDDEVADREYSN